jgi:hypothetical protein
MTSTLGQARVMMPRPQGREASEGLNFKLCAAVPRLLAKSAELSLFGWR